MRETKIECERGEEERKGGPVKAFPKNGMEVTDSCRQRGCMRSRYRRVEGMGKGMKRGWEITLTT